MFLITSAIPTHMGERACYRAVCPNCDLQLSIADETCPECGADIDVDD